MPFLAAILAPLLSTSFHRASVGDRTYTIYFGGAKAGTEVDHQDASGAFSSALTLKLGTAQIQSSVIGQFDGTLLKTADSKVVTPSGTVTTHFSDGKLTVVSGKESKTLDYTPKGVFYAAGLLAGPWSSSVQAALDKLNATRDAAGVSVPAYFIDGGRQMEVRFRSLHPRTLDIGGKSQSVSAVQINLTSVQGELDLNSQGDIVAFDVPGQKLRFVLDGWEGLYQDPLAKYPELSQATFKTTTLAKVSMKTRDGVELVSTIVKPDAEGKFPVIMARTPYGREAETLAGRFYASRGYVFIAQDVRGRGDSGGGKAEWDPFVHEGEDGYDAIQWAAKQPWSSGDVGMIGASYGGYVQWAAAVLNPPALRCIVPQVSPPDAMHNLPYDFGIPFIFANLWWGNLVSADHLDAGAMTAPLPHYDAMASLPLGSLDIAVTGKRIPFYEKWMERTRIQDWKGFDFYQHLSEAKVPALQISGWFDGDGIGTKLIWAKERALGRKDQWLIEGPWTHAFNTSSSIGKIDFGPDALIDLDSVYLRWFDTWLKHKSVQVDSIPKAQIFVTGANKWMKAKDWPDPSELKQKLYLSPSTAGGPSLGALVPQRGQDSYRYDPAQDTDVSGLAKGNDPTDVDGIVDLSKVKTGGFHLFKTEPFQKAKQIAGPAVLDLFFKTDAADTDFFVSVVDIDSEGKVRAIGMPGKIRASYLHGVDRISPLTPGKVYEVKVQPWDFAHEFKAGHRLGLIISSSGFPGYARNLGTVEPVATATKIVVQHNTLLFGPGTPSSFQFEVLAP
jgi:putative CocE/NonD family hydrolase